MSEIIAVAFADIHFHKFKAFNVDKSRLIWSLKAGSAIADVADKHRVPVLFCGDLFHNPKEVENETMGLVKQWYYGNFERRDIMFYAISGNHDFSEKNSRGHSSPSHLDGFKYFKTFRKLDYEAMKINNEWIVLGLPYFNNDRDIKDSIREWWKRNPKGKYKTILMVHSDLPGAVTPEGFKINETEHIKLKHFRDFDLVLSGHIHKPQKLGKKIYMLGSPIHQNLGDEGNSCGYWLIYSDGSVKFYNLKGFPRFRRLKKGEKPTNDIDYWVEPNEVLEEESESNEEFSLNNSRKQLAKKYCSLNAIKSKRRIRELIKVLNQAE